MNTLLKNEKRLKVRSLVSTMAACGMGSSICSDSNSVQKVERLERKFPEKKKKVVVENCRPNACRGETRQPGDSCQGAKGATYDQTQSATNNFRVMHLCWYQMAIAKWYYGEASFDAQLCVSRKVMDVTQSQNHDWSKPFSQMKLLNIWLACLLK